MQKLMRMQEQVMARRQFYTALEQIWGVKMPHYGGPQSYQIAQDREGFYIATDDGWDLCRTYRFGSFKDAEAELVRWIKEDEEAA